MRKLILFLFLATVSFGALLPVADLPTIEPPIPTAPTTSSTVADKTRWLWANWQYQDNLKNRATLAAANTQVATLKGQVAALTATIATLGSGTGGTSSADLVAIKAKIDAIDSKTTQLLADIAEPINARVNYVNGKPSISWDYTEATTNVQFFRIWRGTGDGGSPIIVGTTSGPDQRSWTDTQVTKGNWIYQVMAVSNSWVLVKDSKLTPPLAVVVP